MAINGYVKFFWNKLQGTTGSTLAATSTESTGDYDVDYLWDMLEWRKWLAETNTPGVDWTQRTAAASYAGAFTGIVFGNNLFVTVGDTSGEIQTSPDGITWTQRTAAGSFAGIFYGVTYGNSLFVAVGSSGEIQTSPDGITWTQRTAAGSYAGNFRSAAYGNSLFVIVGDTGEIQTSPDGITWTQRTAAGSYSGSFRGATYGDSLFVIVGSAAGGEIQTSPDGITWTERTPAAGGGTSLYDVAYGGDGIYVLVGSSGTIQTSSDGITWTAQAPDDSYTGTFESVAYGENFPLANFVIVGTTTGTTAEIQTNAGITVLDPQYITLDMGVGNTGTADMLAIAGHNLSTVGATVSLDASATGAFSGEETAIVSGFAPTDDLALYKSFNSAEYRFWRLKITGHSAAPQMGICIWGQVTTLKFATRFDPNAQTDKAIVNVSETGYLLGIYNRYVERRMSLSFRNVSSAIYTLLNAWWEGSGLNNFFVIWDSVNHATEVYLMHPGPEFEFPFDGATRSGTLELTGRKE